MAGWSYCPYEQNFHCKRIKRDCDPGVPGCILYGRIERDDLECAPPVPPRRRPTEKKKLDTEEYSRRVTPGIPPR